MRNVQHFEMLFFKRVFIFFLLNIKKVTQGILCFCPFSDLFVVGSEFAFAQVVQAMKRVLYCVICVFELYQSSVRNMNV